MKLLNEDPSSVCFADTFSPAGRRGGELVVSCEAELAVFLAVFFGEF